MASTAYAAVQCLKALLSDEQIQALIAAPDTRTFAGRRNRMILLTFPDTGCRVSELCGMDVEHVNIPLIRVMGKGRRERLLAFSPAVQREMLRYLRIIIGMALTADGVMLTALLFSLAVLLGLHALRRSQAESAPDAPQRASSRLSSPWPWLVGVGLAGGLAYLAGRFSPLLWVVLAAAVTANMGRSRRAAAAVVLLAALLLGGLWWGRNLAALGTPWPVLERSELVMGTREYPGSSLLWSVTGGPANPVFYLIDLVEHLARDAHEAEVAQAQCPQLGGVAV